MGLQGKSALVGAAQYKPEKYGTAPRMFHLEQLADLATQALDDAGLSLSDVLGSWLFDKFDQTFMNLVWVNAGTTAVVLIVVPFLPGNLVDCKEGEMST